MRIDLKAALVAALVLTVSGLGPATAQEKIKLRVADSFPSSHYVSKFIRAWMDQVSIDTNGQVEFEYFGSEQLGKAKDLLSLTQSGVADIAYVAPSYVSEKMPLSAVAELPGNFDTSCAGTRAYWQLARAGGILEKKELAPNGVRLVFSVISAPYQIQTASKFTTVADLRGLKLRSYGGHQDTATKLLGAVAIRIPGPEMYEAMSRGTLDGLILPLASIMSYKLQDLIKYSSYDLNFGSVAFNYVMNDAKFAKLPANVRQAILKAGDDAVSAACAAVDESTQQSIGKLREAGVTMVELSPADKQLVQDQLRSISPAWASDLDGRGKPGTAVYEAFSDALKATH